jgi:hypothetical protein
MSTYLASACREYPCTMAHYVIMVTTNSTLLKIGSLSRFYFY